MTFTDNDNKSEVVSSSEPSNDFYRYNYTDNTIDEGGMTLNTDYTKDGSQNLTFVANASKKRKKSFRYFVAQDNGTVEVENKHGNKVQYDAVKGITVPCISDTIGANTSVNVIVHF